MNSNKAIYFPGLNGIRAIAAFLVIVAHTSNRLPLFNLKSIFSEDIATHAVTMFFTLSGFLITYLLLAEKERTGTINIRKFYFRRILRIWPLYYTYILIVIIISEFNIEWPILFYILILPNLRISFKALFDVTYGSNSLMNMIGHYWSLGVEEQFYSFWPWLVKKSKNLITILLILPIAYIAIKLLLRVFNAPYGIVTFFNYTRFGCMALGGLGAYLYFFHQENLKFLSHRFFEITSYLFFLLLLTNNFHLTSLIDHEIVSVFTFVIIYNQITNKNVFISLENRVLDFLGKISFGLYVYHPLVIYLFSSIFLDQLNDYPIVKTFMIFIIVPILTIFIAYFSFEYFEKWFLKFKTKYVTVKSASNKHDSNEQ